MKLPVRGRRTHSAEADILSSLRIQAFRESGQASARNEFAKNERATARILELIKTSNDDIARSRIELFSFLGLLIFIAVTTSTITDRTLLVGSRTKFPLLDVTIGIEGFLLISPFVIAAVHFALLLKFDQLRNKCVEINRQLNELKEHGEAEAARNLSLLVGTNFLAQWLVGFGRDGFYRGMNFVVYVLVLILAPLCVLLLLTMRTLPLHQEVWTAIQNAVFCTDVWLVAYFHIASTARKAALTIAVLILSNLLFCVPDSLLDRIGTSIWSTKVPFGSDAATNRRAFFPTAFLLENGLDEATRRPVFSISRNLVVRDDRTLVDTSNASLHRDETKRSDQRLKDEGEPTLSLRGRDLRYALLDRSDLHGADFTLADLSGASLKGANLKGAAFGCAERKSDPFRALWEGLSGSKSPRSYNPVCTALTSVNLADADLTGAKFVESGMWSKPSLREVSLSGARLDFVNLAWADLSGADLSRASLKGIILSGARLVGTKLTGADLTGANLAQANLGLSALNSATLDGADLTQAQLVAAEMTSTSLVGAVLTDAIFTGARLRKARVWMTDPPVKNNLVWADLKEIENRELTRAEKDALSRSLEVLAETSVSPSPVQRLKESLRLDKISENSTRAGDLWLEWASALSRSSSDSDYRKAFNQILFDIGCSNFNYGMAIWSWVTTYGSDVFDGYMTTDALPEPPPDPSLSTIRDFRSPNSFDFYPFEPYPTTINPIPDWTDLQPLSDALKAGQCAAPKELPLDFLPKLDVSIARRAKDRAAAVPK
jgi:uncharacterized protein YjbI with pentapeptide repeats